MKSESDKISMEINSNYTSCTSDKDKYQAAKLMESTETMTTFGFMSMSMTYFSSLNMIKAIKTVTGKNSPLTEAIEFENS